jgi:DNA-binding transcriptional regulator GbsR (MarR family)
MKPAPLSDGMRRVIDFLGELGPRWGLPAAPCRVHGYLYLVGRPVADVDLGQTLEIDDTQLGDALAWLTDYRLITREGAGWRTETDPWDLVMRALEERRARELAPALNVLRECHAAVLADTQRDRTVALQIGKLLGLVEDIAAIDMQARRLSPDTLRQLVNVGGRAARFIDRAFGRKDRP